MEVKKKIPEQQFFWFFGLRKDHSTTHQLLRITEEIEEKTVPQIGTGAVFFDIEEAFDKMWLKGLIYKVKEKILPTILINILKSHLKERKFKVNINATRGVNIWGFWCTA